jgi:hypothetical protein
MDWDNFYQMLDDSDREFENKIKSEIKNKTKPKVQEPELIMMN